jgi:uncharacterized phosphosugar-binding protein
MAINNPSISYYKAVNSLLEQAILGQLDTIHLAAETIGQCLINGGLLHVFGTGHSHMLVEELYGRAGGLMPVNAILLPRLMLHEDMVEATLLERRTEMADDVLSGQPLQAGDVMLIISNSGRNGLPVEIANRARAMGLTVIALTAVRYSRTLESRHSSGLRLFEAADIVLDNHGQPGDACLEFKELGTRSGATSTVIGAAVLNAVVVEVIELLAKEGIQPPVFISANIAGPDEVQSVNALRRAGQRLPFHAVNKEDADHDS